MKDLSIYSLDFDQFNLTPEQFNHPSEIHGIKHTYRVMLHCLILGLHLNRINEARVAFFAAYIHDMAREHDGYCTIHGANASKNKLPLFKTLFVENGASPGDIEIINQIVTLHSVKEEPGRSDNLFRYLAILKDADALDRIRLGRYGLNPGFLRLEETHNLIRFGENLYYATDKLNISSFTEMIGFAEYPEHFNT